MPSRADLKYSQLKVGIVVAIAALALIVVVFAITGESGFFSSHLHIISYVDDAAGLRSGANVNLEGVTIGNVTRVRLDPNPPDPKRPVRIDMRVSANHERWLRTDSRVVLGTAGPLGDTLVNINAGTLKAPPAGNGTVLPAEVATGISELLVTSHTILQNVNDLVNRAGGILDQIQNGKGSIGKLMYSDEFYDRLNNLAGNVEAVSRNLREGHGSLGKLLNDESFYTKLNGTLDRTNALLDQIQKGQGTMAKLINDPSLYHNANELVSNLNRTTQNLNQGRGALGALMTDSPTSEKLKSTIARLDDMLASLQAGKGTAGQLLKDPRLYNNLNQTLDSTRELITAMRQNPKKYLTIHLKIF